MELIKKLARAILSNELGTLKQMNQLAQEEIDNLDKELKKFEQEYDKLKKKSVHELNSMDYTEEVKAKGTAIYRSKRKDFSPSNWISGTVKRSASQLYVPMANLRISQIADTNSMLPTMDGTHEVAYLPRKHFKPEDLKMGDMIIWQKKGSTGGVCHRIVRARGSGTNQEYITQGDNLKFNDGWIKFNQIKGVIVAVFY